MNLEFASNAIASDKAASTNLIPMFFYALSNSASEAANTALEWLKPHNKGISLIVRQNSLQDRSVCYSAASYLQGLRKEPPKLEEFRRNLILSLEEEPIDDGYTHPAERIIKEALVQHKATAANWIQSVYLKNMKRAAVAAGILRCVGRLNRKMMQPWGLVMAISGISHPDIEVRESAVRALESWGGRDSLETLKIYKDIEEVPWLKDYIKQVIVDLSE
jgi:hypothetical protein